MLLGSTRSYGSPAAHLAPRRSPLAARCGSLPLVPCCVLLALAPCSAPLVQADGASRQRALLTRQTLLLRHSNPLHQRLMRRGKLLADARERVQVLLRSRAQRVAPADNAPGDRAPVCCARRAPPYGWWPRDEMSRVCHFICAHKQMPRSEDSSSCATNERMRRHIMVVRVSVPLSDKSVSPLGSSLGYRNAAIIPRMGLVSSSTARSSFE